MGTSGGWMQLPAAYAGTYVENSVLFHFSKRYNKNKNEKILHTTYTHHHGAQKQLGSTCDSIPLSI